jgi:hypothetical protein
MLKTNEPFSKLFYTFKAPDGSEHKIEILGDGQQYVVHGQHPSGRPYEWFGGELATIKREDLPYVRFDDARRFLEATKKLLAEEFDFVVISASSNLASNGGGAPRVRTNGGGNGRADIELVADALAIIPNEASIDWEQWYRVGMAVFRATGGSAEGFAVWDAWSRKSPKYNSDNTARKWANFLRSPPTKIGAGSIIHLARKVDPYWDRPWLRSKANRHGGAQ